MGKTQSQKMASRLRDIMAHTVRYCIDGRSRLIADTGISRSEITRLLSGDCNPSYRVVTAVVAALEKALGRSIDTRDVLSFSGEFPTQSVQELVSCRGCTICSSQMETAPVDASELAVGAAVELPECTPIDFN